MCIDDSIYDGCETILVVDDTLSLLTLMDLVLTIRGYQVITAFDGQDAVEKFSISHDMIDLVLMDVDMPRKNGVAAFHEIRIIKPDTRVLFITGHGTGALDEIAGEVQVLDKPWATSELLRKIREMIDSKQYPVDESRSSQLASQTHTLTRITGS